jgi:hypothetical protein
MIFLFGSGSLRSKIRAIMSLTFQHARNLAAFVGIYKTTSGLLRMTVNKVCVDSVVVVLLLLSSFFFFLLLSSSSFLLLLLGCLSLCRSLLPLLEPLPFPGMPLWLVDLAAGSFGLITLL